MTDETTPFGKVHIGDKEFEVGNLEVDIDFANLDTKDIWGRYFEECSACGAKIHPPEAIIVIGTGGQNQGVFHSDCMPD